MLAKRSTKQLVLGIIKDGLPTFWWESWQDTHQGGTFQAVPSKRPWHVLQDNETRSTPTPSATRRAREMLTISQDQRDTTDVNHAKKVEARPDIGTAAARESSALSSSQTFVFEPSSSVKSTLLSTRRHRQSRLSAIVRRSRWYVSWWRVYSSSHCHRHRHRRMQSRRCKGWRMSQIETRGKKGGEE